MNATAIAKVLTGLAITGGAVATPIVLLKGSNNSGGAIDKKVEDLDGGKLHLKRSFKDCTKLLDDKTRQGNHQQIYLCKLNEDQLEFFYYDKEGSEKIEISQKIERLEQHTEYNYQLKLKVKLENDTNVRTIDWPSSLFEYTPSNQVKSYLFPESDCKFSPSTASTLFECNSTWKVIKRK